MKRPLGHPALAAVVVLAAMSVTVPALAESWKTVYRSSNYANSGRSQEVDLDSVQRSGAFLKYRAREVNPYGHFEQVMVADCTQMTRGQWNDARMYSVYPNTLGGDEVQAICQFGQRSGLISATEASIQPSDASAPVSQPWVPASKDGTRQIRLASLRANRPLVTYRFRFGETDRFSDPTDTELVVEVNCERRTRRDALAWFGTPLGAPHAVDGYGSGFREELDFVCRWAQAQWDRPDTSKSSGANPNPSAPEVSSLNRRAPAQTPTAPTPTSAPELRRQAKLSSGSGFLVSARQVITNNHVSDGCLELTVRRGDVVTRAVVKASTAAGDLALLTTEQSMGSGASLRATAMLGEDVMVAGHPLSSLLSNDLIVTGGQVNSLAGLGNDPSMLQVSAPIQPGNSGGPLIDRSGSVVGVVVSKLNVERIAKVTGDMAQNVNFAIKPEVLRLFLDTNRVQYRTASIGQRLDGIVLAERARGFTVQILCER